ncbi:Protein kinase domain-containing protein [Aphelenchoides fujianensis]|nr:Protein kinase domain-containing protein [Aphelenchoides fujianensis]
MNMNTSDETDETSLAAKRRPPKQAVNKFANIEIGDMIGKGGFGEVFKARWESKRVAVKKCPLPGHGKPMDLDPHAEAKIMRELSGLNPHLIEFFGTYEDRKHFCIVMEYCRHGSVYDYVKAKGPFSIPAVRKMALDIATVLDLIHQRNYLYRDLSPKNVLISKYDSNQIPYIKLIDFGLSKHKDEVKGTTCGTPGFTAAKHAKQSKWKPCMDYYSLGCVLMYMLTKKLYMEQGHGLEARHVIKYVTDKNAQSFVLFLTQRWADIKSITPIQRHSFILEEVIEQQSMNSKSRTELPTSQTAAVLAPISNGEPRPSREVVKSAERSSKSSGHRKSATTSTATTAPLSSSSRPVPELPAELLNPAPAPPVRPPSQAVKTFGPSARQPRSASVAARPRLPASHAASVPNGRTRNPSAISVDSEATALELPWPLRIDGMCNWRKIAGRGRVTFDHTRKLVIFENAPKGPLEYTAHLVRAGNFNQTLKIFKPKPNEVIVDWLGHANGYPIERMVESRKFASLEQVQGSNQATKIYQLMVNAHKKISQTIRTVLEYPFDNLDLVVKIMHDGRVTARFGMRMYTFRTALEVDYQKGLSREEKEQCKWILEGRFIRPPNSR